MSIRRHSPLAAFLVAACASGAVVLGSVPAAAAKGLGASTTVYPAAVSFSGSVRAALTTTTSGLSLRDYLSPDYDDRLSGSPAGIEFLDLQLSAGAEPTRCRHDRKGGLAGISVYSADPTWAGMEAAGTRDGTLGVQCLFSDGTQHLFSWGYERNPDGSTRPSPAGPCVTIHRDSADTFRLIAADGCRAQDMVVNSRIQQVGQAVLRDMPFTAVITLSSPG